MQHQKQDEYQHEPLFQQGFSTAQQKMEMLEKMWLAAGRKRHESVLAYLRSCFEEADNCYLCAVYFMSNASDFYKTKSSGLAYTVMDEFGLWVKMKSSAVAHHLTIHMKTEALHRVLKQKNTMLVQLVCAIYQLKEHKDIFVELIKFLCGKSRYAEAAACATSLELQDRFTLQEIIIPLILQDKINMVEMYIKDLRQLQVELVKFLDMEFNSLSKIQRVISQLKIPGIRLEKSHPRAVGKLLSRLLKVYDISPENCPNLCYMRRLGGMKHLLYKKYTEKSMTDNGWDEMIQDTVGSNESLQKELVMELACNNDNKAALKWANFYNIPQSDWPPTLRQFCGNVLICTNNEDVQRGPDVTSDTLDNIPSEEDWDVDGNGHAENYLTLRLPTCSINFVSTPDQYFSAVADISQNHDVVGVDAEWKPSFGVHNSRLSLVQLAVWDSVYLFDIISLSDCLEQAQWDALLTDIFRNPNLLKLGYSVHGDLQMLANAVHCDRSFLRNVNRVLDLEHFCKKLQNDYPQLFNTTEENNEDSNHDSKGLSDLSRIILGSPLDKSEQFSDWEKRPLRETQMTYAALDSFCLLQIYEELYSRAEKQGFSLDELINSYFNSSHQSKKCNKAPSPKKKAKKNINLQVPQVMPNHDPVDAQSFKVVVDTMLQGLGRHLRLYGVDTVILENRDDHSKAAKIALQEDRIILTSGGPYQMLSRHVPIGRCLNIPCDLAAKEQAEMVFRHYNVQVTEADIFTRCPTDPVPQMPTLHEQYSSGAATTSASPFQLQPWPKYCGTGKNDKVHSAQERAIAPDYFSSDDEYDDDDYYC